MIRIRVNVTGIPTDFPTIMSDTGVFALGDITVPGRCTFNFPDDLQPHGGWLRYAKNDIRIVLALSAGVPLQPGDYEGGLMCEPIPDLVYR